MLSSCQHVTKVNCSYLSKNVEASIYFSFWLQNLPFNDSNEKTESAEAKIPNNNARVINVMHSVVGELGQGEGKRIHDVLESEPEEHIQKSNGTSTDEKNEVANVSEAYKTTESTILKDSSTEGMVRMEMIAKTSENTADLETVSGLVSEENFVVKEAEVIVPEVSKEEAIDTETHQMPTSELFQDFKQCCPLIIYAHPSNIENQLFKV